MKKKNLFKILEDSLGDSPFSIITSVFFSAIFAGLIIWICFNIGANTSDHVINILVVLLGALVGWALGIYFAPFDEKEAIKFSSIGQAVSVFISGYVISKLDRFFEATLFIREGDQAKIIMSTWTRVGLFFSALILSTLTVFINRSYFRRNIQNETQQNENTKDIGSITNKNDSL